MRIAVPKANGLDNANAQGQAIISTAVNAFKASEGSNTIHHAALPKAITNKATVK